MYLTLQLNVSEVLTLNYYAKWIKCKEKKQCSAISGMASCLAADNQL